MKLEAVVTFPGDIDLVALDAEPEAGKLVLRGEKLNGAEVWADGHRIGTALAVDRQEFEPWYQDAVAPVGAIVHRTLLAMVLEVPLPGAER